MTSPPDIVDREGICTGGVADVDVGFVPTVGRFGRPVRRPARYR